MEATERRRGALHASVLGGLPASHCERASIEELARMDIIVAAAENLEKRCGVSSHRIPNYPAELQEFERLRLLKYEYVVSDMRYGSPQVRWRRQNLAPQLGGRWLGRRENVQPHRDLVEFDFRKWLTSEAWCLGLAPDLTLLLLALVPLETILGIPVH